MTCNWRFVQLNETFRPSTEFAPTRPLPSLAVHTKLALKMGWLRKISSGLILGPNLQQEFMADQIPNMKKNSDWNDLDDKDGNPVF